MQLRRIIILTAAISFLGIFNLRGQQRIFDLDEKLQSLSERVPGLNDTITLSVNEDMGLFLRAIALQSGINMNISTGITQQLNNNFANITVREIILFLCREYNLDLEITGSIISVKKYQVPADEISSGALKISYVAETNQITMDIRNQEMGQVAKWLVDKTPYNIVVVPGVENTKVNIYQKDLDFDKAMENLGVANNLKIKKGDGNIYYVQRVAINEGNTNNNGTSSANDLINFTVLNQANFSVNDSLLTLNVSNAPIMDLLRQVSMSMSKNYFLYSDLTGNITLSVKDITYETFLKHILLANNYSFKKDQEVYIIGNKDLKHLNSSRIIVLQYRSVDKVLEQVPGKLKDDVDITPFLENNSFLVSGSEPKIMEFESFIRQIDQPVPVVMIELMIIDYSDSRTLAAGIEAGLSDKPVTTKGTVLPGLDVTLGAPSINGLLGALSSNSIINLGKVSPNFYVTIQALESNGILRTRSNPRLSTLNGHLAEITLGTKEYYLQITNNTIGAQVPQVVATEQYIPIEANFNVKITPFVSADEQVTMDISVSQSDFTERTSPTAPPGTVTRSFRSLIRVKDQEMVLLGGLEDLKESETGKGFPFINRVPVLNWILGKRNNQTSKSKLLVFIRPTVFY